MQKHARFPLHSRPHISSNCFPVGHRLDAHLGAPLMFIPGRHLDLVLMKELKIHLVKVKKQEMPRDRKAASTKMDQCV